MKYHVCGGGMQSTLSDMPFKTRPLPIVIPCHRVIGSSGKLTGFYGGLHLKEGLLALERRADAPADASAQH